MDRFATTSLFSIWGSIRRHPWRALVSLGLLAKGLDWLGDLQTITPIAQWLDRQLSAAFGHNWADATLAAWWFKLACLALSFWLLWRIGSLAEHERIKLEDAAKARNDETDGRTQSLLNRAWLLPEKLVQHFSLVSALKYETAALDSIESCISSYANLINNLADGGAQRKSRFMATENLSMIENICRQIGSAYAWAGGGPRAISPNDSQPVLTVETVTPHPPHYIFDPTHNTTYLSALRANLTEMNQHLSALRNILRVKQSRINVLALEIERQHNGR